MFRTEEVVKLEGNIVKAADAFWDGIIVALIVGDRVRESLLAVSVINVVALRT